MTETHKQRFARVFARQRETLVIAPDDFRVDENGVYSHAGDWGIVGWKMALDSLHRLLPKAEMVLGMAGAPGAGKSTWVQENARAGVLYLDSTLTRKSNRREVCAIAYETGRRAECLLLHPKLEVCLERNQRRGRQVPEDYVRNGHHRLCVCPPGLDEGWAAVEVVGDGLDSAVGLL